MNVVTPDQVAVLIGTLWIAGLIGGALAVFVGSLSRDFVFMFVLRRFGAWRRFDRAMRKLFA